MKVHILFEFVDGPWGGGNQFLKALKNQWKKKNIYANCIDDADVILFNSYPFRHENFFDVIFEQRKKKKLIFHRLDGPISLVRGKDFYIDEAIFAFNNLFADGTIYQSSWIKENCLNLGLQGNKRNTVIMNAPDKDIFYKNQNHHFNKNKIKLIATSWSGNWRKGFDVYKWLDENLNFDRYQMTFIGNSPIEFNNIKHKKPMNSYELGNELRQNDIYIAASRNEPCSNALIEAMHCGLPAVGFQGGGTPEIIGKAGECFSNKDEIPSLLERIESTYFEYRDRIQLLNIDKISDCYYTFMLDVLNNIEEFKPVSRYMFNNFKRKHNLNKLSIKQQLKTKIKRVIKNNERRK